ncbi:MAG: VOC family protein [Elusimicrobia bacterium]|nr:VOC family protein [Elusimicrobiota bacterium]
MTRVARIALLVRDYDEAKRFYCETLGFLAVEDMPLAKGKRWVVITAREGPELVLSKASDETQAVRVGDQAGGRVFLFLHTDDLAADCLRLAAKGVEFVEGPRREVYGKVAVFKDLYGNRIDLIEPTRS